MKTPVTFLAGLGLLLGPIGAWGQESSLANSTQRAYKDEVVRLMTVAAATPAGSFIVREDGAEVPYQVEEIGGKNWIWVCSSFEAGTSHRYQVATGRPRPATPRVAVRKDADIYVLDNGLVAVELPAAATGGIPGPVTAVKLGDKWVGGSVWHTSFAPSKFTATVVGDGTILGKVRLRYDFAGKAGLEGNVPAFAEVDVALGPGWRHVEIFERHEMARGDYWEFEASKGWSPTQGVSKPFSGGAGSGEVAGKVEPVRALRPGGVRVGKDEIAFSGDHPTAGGAARYVAVSRDGREVLALAGKDIDMNRSQGDAGLFVPDAGYPFGEIPDWLIRQRAKRPDWAK